MGWVGGYWWLLDGFFYGFEVCVVEYGVVVDDFGLFFVVGCVGVVFCFVDV